LLSLLNIWLIHANPPFFEFNLYYSKIIKGALIHINWANRSFSIFQTERKSTQIIN
jgi:hypothetical protein